ncbi:(d)CMP kinase [Candidatus Microgenomates bacterium]|nr:(d)CMP kinase [Candidatus Microgenomates bacterium]
METDVITIDGPTSSGKNSVGFLLAQELGYQYIDTGSIYRAGCVFIIKNEIPLDGQERIVQVFKDLTVGIKMQNHNIRVIANGEDVTDILHNADVTKIVPEVAAIRKVREATKIIQHNLGKVKNTVMTGRDIGSEIFPDAKYKFFLTASSKVRAKRRFKQLVEKDPSIKYEDVLKGMMDRDKKDSEREASPMRIPKGAFVIDNTNLTVEETVDQMLKYITGSGK